MSIQQLVLVTLLACLMACGGPRVVDAGDLLGRHLIYRGETATTYRIRVEEWEIRSNQSLPLLRSAEEVEILKTRILKDSRLQIGDLLLVDGATLRPVPPAFTIPIPEVTGP